MSVSKPTGLLLFCQQLTTCCLSIAHVQKCLKIQQVYFARALENKDRQHVSWPFDRVSRRGLLTPDLSYQSYLYQISNGESEFLRNVAVWEVHFVIRR